MVHLAAAVKVEVEDPLEDENAPLYKRSRISPQWGSGVDMVRQITPLDLLEEPSPLGLRLRKSPSLLDLIQMRLSQPVSATMPCVVSCEDIKSVTVSGTSTEKLKASNFPLTLLRIGTWECVSRYEGDLVAKCYFAKHKLVWEVLEGGLKSKIEIQWSDITSLRATYPENGPGTLDIVMARQPLFFKETNPQPRKHTLWQATLDFTSGQAGKHRRHFLQCPQGILNKHFEKLIQCDPHLNKLSQQPEIIQESSYFEPWGSAFEDGEELKVLGFDHLKDTCGSTSSVFGDHGTPCAPSSISTRSDVKHPVCTTKDNMPPHGSPCTSVMSHRFVHTREIENNTGKDTGEPKGRVYRDQLKFPGIKASISMHDLVNHIEHCISNQAAPGNPFVSSDGSPNKGMLEELTQHLLSDSQASSSASDEKSLMSRVNSLFSLLHNDDKPHRPMPATERKHPMFDLRSANEVLSDVSVYKQPVPSISRIESFGELLMHLPRIASLPQMMLKRTA